MKEYMDIENRIIEKDNDLILLFKNMINAFVLFHSVFDEKGNFISYRFVYINDAYEKITGVKNKDVKGKTIHEVWPETEPEWIEKYGNVAMTGISNSFEMFHKPTLKLYNCNVYRPFDNNARFCVIFEDITDRKKNETEILKAKDKVEESWILLQNIADSIPAYIAAVDINTLKYVFVNKKFVTGFKRPKNEIIGAHISDIIGQEKYEFALEYINAVRNGESTSYINTFDVAEGEKSFNVNYVPGYNQNSQLTNILVLTFDITELIKAKEKAEESDRLKTAFLQNMSHEIRTPLNAISGFSGILNKSELSEEKRRSYTSIIQNSSEQLISIISDILTISSLETKQENISYDKVCVNNIILDLLSIFKQQAHNQNISLYTKQQLSDKQAEIYTDKTKITQILSNLISNALKFTHEGFIEFGYNLKEHELEFYVKDSGIGIKPEFHEEIFERFRQANKSINKLYGGTGLGLSISKGFTDLLGGKIWVQSELEKGSTFYFTIPYKPVNESDKAISPIMQSRDFKTVLVAEDEEYNFLYIEEVLIDMDLKLIHAKDGKETVEIFKSNTNIDLILMDIKMPIMDGHEAAKIIKELKPDFPIIAQSAYALEHEIEKYSGIFDDYLTKPINEDYLKQKVMKYIEKQ